MGFGVVASVSLKDPLRGKWQMGTLPLFPLRSASRSSGATTVRIVATDVAATGELGTVGLLKKGLSVFRQRCEENDAGASDATAAVADDRFRVGFRPSSKAGLFNSPTVPDSPRDFN